MKPTDLFKSGIQKGRVFKKWPKHAELIAEPKLDGFRMHAIIDANGNVTFCTRRHTEPYTTNLAHIGEQLRATGLRDCMIDGEIVGKDFASTSVIRRKNAPRAVLDDIRFFVFDWVALSQLTARRTRVTRQVFNTPLRQRRLVLEEALVEPAEHLILMPQLIVRNEEEVLRVSGALLADGYEGLMLKAPESPYIFGSRDNWWKVKPFVSVDAKIVGFIEGGGKFKGTLGAIKCVAADGTEFGVGTGFSDRQRNEIWARRAELMGTTLEAKIQDTESWGGKGARHPVFMRLRVDRD